MIFTTGEGATRFSCDLNTCPQRPRNAAHVCLWARGVQCPDHVIFKIRFVINCIVSPGNSGRTAGEKLVLSFQTSRGISRRFPKRKHSPWRKTAVPALRQPWGRASCCPRRSPHGLCFASSSIGFGPPEAPSSSTVKSVRVFEENLTHNILREPPES